MTWDADGNGTERGIEENDDPAARGQRPQCGGRPVCTRTMARILGLVRSSAAYRVDAGAQGGRAECSIFTKVGVFVEGVVC